MFLPQHNLLALFLKEQISKNRNNPPSMPHKNASTDFFFFPLAANLRKAKTTKAERKLREELEQVRGLGCGGVGSQGPGTREAPCLRKEE